MKFLTEMFNSIYKKYGDKVEILTGIPKPKRNITTAAEDKINWVHRLFGTEITVNTVLREEKKNFCTGPECILIDDLKKNISEWEEIFYMSKSSKEILMLKFEEPLAMYT